MTYDDYVKVRDKYVDEAIEALEELILVKHAERMRKKLKLLESLGGHKPGGGLTVEALQEENWS
ncbi:MAG: hypothetical protein GSR85_11795 [Desulfurococcales archaeon]|nr:hypothetical protein [Desulfurococcales archaeon]